MSRIRFEWNIESRKIDRSDGEDPQAKLRRRRNALRLLLLIILVVAAIVVGALVIRQRLVDVQTEVAQFLQDTVKAEVAALRIGDLNTFLNIQSADSDQWISRQRVAFQQYSDLKASNDIELTGSILAVDIDDARARVLVQENIKGLPYVRLWFYQREDDGWHHAPLDYAYWGETAVYEGAGIRVDYRTVDNMFAQQLGEALAAWIDQGCQILDCGDLPTMTVEVVTEADAAATWANDSSMQLIVRSPYVDIARADTPYDSALRQRISLLLAERLINLHTNYLQAIYPNDAYYIRGAASLWLAEQFTRTEYGAWLIKSIANNYGLDSVSRLLSRLKPTDDMSIVDDVIPDSIAQANLDWRDFVEWRLNTEAELIAARAQDDWLRLYDTSDEQVRLLAYERYNRNAPGSSYHALGQEVLTSDDGSPQLRVTVEVGEDAQPEREIVLFNLVGNVWKRAS